MIRKLFLLFLILVLSVGCAQATDYYVSTTGDNGATGTIEAPWATPSYGLTQLSQFDTLYIAEGSYLGGLSIPSDNISVIGLGTVWLNGSGSGNAIEINFKDNYYMENLNFFNFSQGAQEFGCNNYIKNCTFGNFTSTNNGWAAYIEGHLYAQARSKALENVTFTGCTFYNCDVTMTGEPNMINIDGADPSLSEPTAHDINFINTEIYGTASHQIFNIKSKNVGYGTYAYNGLEDLDINGVYIHNIVTKTGTYPNALYTIYGGAENTTLKNATLVGLPRYAIRGNYINSTFENIAISGITEGYPGVSLESIAFAKLPTNTTFKNVSVSGTALQSTIFFDSTCGLENKAEASSVQYYESKSTMDIISPVSTVYDIRAKGNGSASLSYPNGRIITATLTSANAPYTFVAPVYTPSGTTCTLTQQTGGTTSSVAHVVVYNYSAKPAVENATITPRAPVGSEILNFTAESTNGNLVTFDAWNLIPSAQYTIKEDGSVKSTQLANETGHISWNNDVWSEHIYTVILSPPVAAFSASPLSGAATTYVTFTDESTLGPTSWLWDFGDGTTSTLQNPVHTYSTNGTFTVNLTVSNAAGSDSEVKTDYITITDAVYAPVASFSANVTSGALPLDVLFTDSSTNTPTSWLWNFGDGTTSTDQNPEHTYSVDGSYTVTLTASNAAGSNTYIKSSYISAGTTTSFSLSYVMWWLRVHTPWWGLAYPLVGEA